MLQNDYLVAKIGVDTAENEPRKERCAVADTALSAPSSGLFLEVALPPAALEETLESALAVLK